MLVAYGPDNQPVIADETPLEQLQRWSRERLLHCPNCRGIVYVRGGAGKQTQVHFAHQRGECAWSTETESVRHMQGKRVLAQWVRRQFPHAIVTLEERLPGPNRIADIFVTHPDKRHWAIEFQCAPLNYVEWRHRHEAYRKANIHDIWIVGDNRREKRESFIEAILTTSRELMFLEPLALSPHIWLRWLLSSDIVQHWPHLSQVTLEQRNSHGDYCATLDSTLTETYLNAQGIITHSLHNMLGQQAQQLKAMQHALQIDETMLIAYLRPHLDNKAIHVVLIPLIKSYLRDPDMMRRYNYGRGLSDEPVSENDIARVQKAQQWIDKLRVFGYKKSWWESFNEILPTVGPYTAFTRYVEMLLTLSRI